MEKFICGECNSVLEFEQSKRGSRIIEMILWSTLVIPGLIYSIWRKSARKKICYYCGSDFVFPDSVNARSLIKSIEKNKNPNL